MWRWLWGTTAVVVIVATIITWQAKRCEAAREQYQPAITANHLTNPMPVISTGPNSSANQKQTQNQARGTCTNANAYLCRVLTPANLPTIYLVLIGAGGIVVAVSTLKILEKQTEAAFLNAQAAINSERPWLVVRPIAHKILDGHYFFRITNRGRTPAKIVSANFGHAFAPTPNDLPISPPWEPFIAPNQRLLPSGDYFHVQTTWKDLETGINVRWLANNPPADRLATDIIFFFGNIIYEDALGGSPAGSELHETRWCFAYFSKDMRFVTTGPSGERGKEYNDYT